MNCPHAENATNRSLPLLALLPFVQSAEPAAGVAGCLCHGVVSQANGNTTAQQFGTGGREFEHNWISITGHQD